MRPSFFPIVLFAASSALALAQSTPSPALLVLSKQDHTVAIVDPATLQVVARAPVGDDPHEVAASSDGRTAYVSNYGFGAFHTITVIDLVAQKQEKVIDLTPLRGPHGLDFVDGKLWFTAEANKVIGRYDPATNKVDWIMGTGQNRTHMLYVFPGAKRIVTTNVNSGTVSILDFEPSRGGPPPGGPGAPGGPPPPPGFPRGAIVPPGGDWNPTVVPVGSRDEGFDVSPDGKEAWVANAGDGTVSVVDLDAKRVTATLPLNVQSANRLKFTPDGKRVLISMLGQGDLLVVDTATHQVEKRIPIGHGGAGILVQPDGARAYVACTPDNYVAVIDLKTLSVTGHIQPGGGPDGLAWAVREQ
ncbi:MAG TPA: YncE family protein [Terracidiphilus sp.]|nr:YncE family protein [Terracidiphilus sp.]